MNRRIISILTSICLLFSLIGCTANERYSDTNFFAMDTIITLRLPQSVSEEIRARCTEHVTALEQQLSRTVSTSEIAQLNTSPAGEYTLSEETAAILQRAMEVAQKTNGAYDPTIAPLSVLWNITGASPSVPSPEAISDARLHVGYEQLSLTGNRLLKQSDSVMLDLGGCAKGYACQSTVEELQNAGVTHGIVSFGGNIGVFGTKADGTPWKIGIKNPVNPNESAGYLYITDGYVSVSGDYERYFEANGKRYHHIFDRMTGYPADSGIRSVAVYAKDAVFADAYSTALFVMGADAALAFYESEAAAFEAVFYLADGRTVITPGLYDCYEHQTNSFSAPA